MFIGFVGIISIIVSAVVSIGLRLLASALQKTPEQEFNESIPESSYRRNIPKPYNLYRYEVNWIEPKGEDEAFWEKKRGRGKNKRNVLFGLFLGAVCNAETNHVRFWVNSKGRANELHTDTKALEAGRNFVKDNIIWMDGNYEQTGWSKGRLEVANKGLLDALGDQFSQRKIGYRGVTCVGFTNADLSEDFKTNTFPTVSVLVRTKTLFDLAAINTDICKDADITATEIDTSELVGIEVNGFDRPQNGTSYAEDIANLAAAFRFFVTETPDGILSFRRFKRPGVTKQLKWQNLIPLDDGRLWGEKKADIRDLPETIALNFIDAEQDYKSNSVVSDIEPRAVNQHQESISVNVIFSEAEAKDLANWHLNQLWIRYVTYDYRLSVQDLGDFNIGDILVLPDGTSTQVHNFKVGANYLIEVNAVRCDDLSQNSITTVNNEPQAVPLPDVSQVSNAESYYDDGTINYGQLYLLDIPAADKSHAELGYYCFSDRASSTLYVDRGNDFEEELSFVEACTFGNCDSILGPIDNNNLTTANLPLIDEVNTLDVTLESGSLTFEISNSQLAAQEQVAFVGRFDGTKWIGEYIGFQYADPMDSGIHKLEKLVRGLNGTEYYIDQHQAGEKFFLLVGDTAYWERVIYEHSEISSTNFGKLQVVPNQDLRPTPLVSVNLVGQSIYPYSPVDVELSEDPEGNLVFDFQVRDRGLGRTLGETNTEFAIDLLDQGSVIRSLSGNQAPLIYPQKQKLLDNLGAVLDANIYKISNIVGRGNPGLLRSLEITGINNTIVTPGVGESKGFKYISSYYQIQPEDDGYFLLIDTNTSNINIGLAEIATVKLWMQNVGPNKVNLIGNLTTVDSELRQNEAIYLVNRSTMWHGIFSGRVDIPKHLIVNTDFTLSHIHHNKIVSVESATSITCNLNETVFDNPQDFHTTIRKKGEGDIYFQTGFGPASNIESVGTTLATKYRAAYVGYEGNGVWILLGALQ